MGFFNGTGVNSYITESDFMTLVDNDRVVAVEGTDLMAAAYTSIAESEANWNAIMKRVAMTELNYFAENGEEMVYTEATTGGFLTKAKEFFLNIWHKIQALFKRFAVMVGSWTKSDKDFVSKYKTDIALRLKNIPSDHEFKGFNYTVDEVKKLIKADMIASAGSKVGITGLSASATKDTFKGAPADNYEYSDKMEELRAEFLGKTGKMEQSEFSSELYKLLRNGEDSKIDIALTADKVNTAMTELQTSKDVKKAAQDSYKVVSKAFDEVIKALDKLNIVVAKEMPTSGSTAETTNALTNINRAVSISRGAAGLVQTMNAAYLTALKDWSRQNKAICVKVMGFKNSTNEGASIEHYSENAMFDVTLK